MRLRILILFVLVCSVLSVLSYFYEPKSKASAVVTRARMQSLLQSLIVYDQYNGFYPKGNCQQIINILQDKKLQEGPYLEINHTSKKKLVSIIIHHQ